MAQDMLDQANHLKGIQMKTEDVIQRHRVYILHLLFLSAFIMRLFMAISNYTYANIIQWKDAALYISVGESFAAGNFFPTTFRHAYLHIPPGLPMIIAICAKAFGNAIFPMLVLNSLAGASLVVVLFLTGEQMIGPKSALFLSLWATLNINMMRYGFQMLKEPYIFLSLALLVLYLWRYAMNKLSARSLIIVMVVSAALIHIDDRYLYLVPYIFIFVFIVGITRKHISNFICGLLVFFALLIPWNYRNYIQYKQIVVMTTNVHSTLQKFLGDELLPTPQLLVQSRKAKDNSVIDNKQVEITEDGRILEWNKGFYGYIVAFIEHMRPTYLRESWVYTLDGWGIRKWSLGHNLMGLLFYGIFLPIYMMSFILAGLRRHGYLLIILFLPLLHGMMHAYLPFPLERYRMATDFIVVLGALWALNEVAVIYKTKHNDKSRATMIL